MGTEVVHDQYTIRAVDTSCDTEAVTAPITDMACCCSGGTRKHHISLQTVERGSLRPCLRRQRKHLLDESVRKVAARVEWRLHGIVEKHPAIARKEELWPLTAVQRLHRAVYVGHVVRVCEAARQSVGGGGAASSAPPPLTCGVSEATECPRRKYVCFVDVLAISARGELVGGLWLRAKEEWVGGLQEHDCF